MLDIGAACSGADSPLGALAPNAAALEGSGSPSTESSSRSDEAANFGDQLDAFLACAIENQADTASLDEQCAAAADHPIAESTATDQPQSLSTRDDDEAEVAFINTIAPQQCDVTPMATPEVAEEDGDELQ